MKRFISKQNLISFSGILLLIIVWKIVSTAAGSAQIVPSPRSTLLSVWKVFENPEYWNDIGFTIGRGLLGFAVSLFLGLLIGIPAGINRNFFYFINPLLVTIRSTPIVSIILLAIIWLGNEWVPVFIALLTMFPVICLNIIEGISSVDRNLIEMSRIYNIPAQRILSEVYLPSIAPFLTSGISNAMGFGWRAIIIGEVLSQPLKGIGSRMKESQYYLEVSEVIAWTLIAIIVSFIFESIIRKTEKIIVVWKKE